jgi:hypothetical protein
MTKLMHGQQNIKNIKLYCHQISKKGCLLRAATHNVTKAVDVSLRLLQFCQFPAQKKPSYFKEVYFDLFTLFKNLEILVYLFSDLSRNPGC